MGSFGIDDATAMIVAVGAAQASIRVASLMAAIIDEVLVCAWLPAMMAGTALGSPWRSRHRPGF